MNILVVEDNPLNRRLVRDLLELNGHRVREAECVADGRAELQRTLPDLVLLDVGIPGGGGELLLAEIRGNPSLAGLPVVAVTAYAMQGDRERLLKAGFDEYISKPINTRTFVVDVETIAKRRLATV